MTGAPGSVVDAGSVLANVYSFSWRFFVYSCNLAVVKVVVDVINEFDFRVDLPPFLKVMDEIGLECLSIRGKAWTAENRRFINCEYRSPLLDGLQDMWEQKIFDGDPRIAERSKIYIDPRLAAFYSMMYVDLSRWQGLVRCVNEMATEESVSFWERMGYGYPIENEFSKKELTDIAINKLSEIGFFCEKKKNGEITDVNFRVSSGGMGSVLSGFFGIGSSKGRAIFDTGMKLERKVDGRVYVSALPLRQLLMPYAGFYLNEFNDSRRLLFGIDLATRLFDAIRAEIGKSSVN